MIPNRPFDLPGEDGYYGDYGGCYAPEVLFDTLTQIGQVYSETLTDPKYQTRFAQLRSEFSARPTPLYLAPALTEYAGGAKIYLKREDLAHTGAHNINNALGQGLLARRLNKERLIASSGSGQHGLALAAVARLLGMSCTIYMGVSDMSVQALNVERIRALGANLIQVEAGHAAEREANAETVRDWVANLDNTHHVLASITGPHPYPMMVRDFQKVIGEEVKIQLQKTVGRLPDHLLAAVGGGSNAIGLFHPFLENSTVAMTGIEAAGYSSDSGAHSNRFGFGSLGIFQGCRTWLLQDDDGQIQHPDSVARGLAWPLIGPELAHLHQRERINMEAVTDDQAITAFQLLRESEGILGGLESAHAVAYGLELAETMDRDCILVINISGGGEKDLGIVESRLQDV